MNKPRFLCLGIVMVLFGLAACAPAAETEEPMGLPNPASVYCEEQGGRLEMRTDQDGTYGVCIFEDGSECEEWAFYRGECSPGSAAQEESGVPDVGLANPASVYCEEQNYKLESRTGEGGVYSVCVFDDGGECEEWAYWRGECGPASNEGQVNLALEARLGQAVSLELLELDASGEGGDPYRPLLLIEEEPQLGDIVRSLNIATPRTPKTFCIPTFLLRFRMADGTLQELGYMCDPSQPTLSGEADFWQNQEAAAPALFVALMDSHLGSE